MTNIDPDAFYGYDEAHSNAAAAVICIDIGGERHKYPSIHKASIATGIPRSSIRNCADGYAKQAGNMLWMYADDDRYGPPKRIY